jgi:hypothetical protein
MVRVAGTDGAFVVRGYAGGSVVMLAWNTGDEQLRARINYFTMERSPAVEEGQREWFPFGDKESLYHLQRYHYCDYTAVWDTPYVYRVSAFDASSTRIACVTLSITVADPFRLTHGEWLRRTLRPLPNPFALQESSSIAARQAPKRIRRTSPRKWPRSIRKRVIWNLSVGNG